MITPLRFKPTFVQWLAEAKARRAAVESKLIEIVDLFIVAPEWPTLDEGERLDHEYWDTLAKAIGAVLTPSAEEHLRAVADSITDPSQQWKRQRCEMLLNAKPSPAKTEQRTKRKSGKT